MALPLPCSVPHLWSTSYSISIAQPHDQDRWPTLPNQNEYRPYPQSCHHDQSALATSRNTVPARHAVDNWETIWTACAKPSVNSLKFPPLLRDRLDSGRAPGYGNRFPSEAAIALGIGMAKIYVQTCESRTEGEMDNSRVQRTDMLRYGQLLEAMYSTIGHVNPARTP
jgi:hypothetical protein